MRRFFTRRPSPAMLVGFIALLAALSGTAVALPGVNLIDSGDIKNGQVKRKDLGRNAVNGAKVANGSLTTADVKDESLTPSDFSGSLQGPAGPTGPKGDQGPGGPVGPTFATTFSNPQDPVPPAAPDSTVLNGQYSHTFVTPSSGRLLVFASLRLFGVNCSVGNGFGFLYLDGVGVPGSGRFLPSTANAGPYAPIALTGPVPAGEHTLRISYDCPGGNPSADTSSGDGDLGAVLVGG